MTPSVDHLRELAGLVQRGDPRAEQALQAELQPGLIHIVRRALRTGKANPALNRWLENAIRSDSAPEAGRDQDPAEVARILCSGLVRQLNPGSPHQAAADTVTDRGGGRCFLDATV
jgi:hypothetical protein